MTAKIDVGRAYGVGREGLHIVKAGGDADKRLTDRRDAYVVQLRREEVGGGGDGV